MDALLVCHIVLQETVAPPDEANNSHRGRAVPKDEFPLSDLLDLEIKWSSELEKLGSCPSNETLVQSKIFKFGRSQY